MLIRQNFQSFITYFPIYNYKHTKLSQISSDCWAYLFLSMDSKQEMWKYLHQLPVSTDILGPWFCYTDFFCLGYWHGILKSLILNFCLSSKVLDSRLCLQNPGTWSINCSSPWLFLNVTPCVLTLIITTVPTYLINNHRIDPNLPKSSQPDSTPVLPIIYFYLSTLNLPPFMSTQLMA